MKKCIICGKPTDFTYCSAQCRSQGERNRKQAEERAEKQGKWNCTVCGAKFSKRGGYAGTDLCGPCCTGEAETIEEFGTEW